MAKLLTGRLSSSGYRSEEFVESVFLEILHRMANGESATSITRPPKNKTPTMPSYSIFMSWVNSSPERFQQYARAKQCQADFYAEEIVEIADTDFDNNRARNRMDARRWHSSKMNPKKYGDKVIQEGSIDIRQKIDLSTLTPDVRSKLRNQLIASMKSSNVIDGEFKRNDT